MTQPDGRKLKVPVVKDAGTFIYLANPDGTWPANFIAKLLYDATWMIEQTRFELENIAPGEGMGKRETVQVIEAQNIVAVDRSGRYSQFGQVKKRVLVTPVANTEALREATASELAEGSEKKELTEADVDRLLEEWMEKYP